MSFLDSNLVFSLVDGAEGVLSVLAAIVNVCILNLYLLPPGVIAIIIIILIYIYSRQVIITCKELDLQSKSPIISLFTETLKGLTQIRVY